MDLMVNPTITGFRQDVDGTIKELKLGEAKQDAWANIAEQGASAKLDNNKAQSINVSTYTEPVEVLPTSGKDGMKKATITLTNIPSPSGVSTLYHWVGSAYDCYTTTPTPTTSDVAYVGTDGGTLDVWNIASVGEDTITISPESDPSYTRTNTRDATGDISLT